MKESMAPSDEYRAGFCAEIRWLLGGLTFTAGLGRFLGGRLVAAEFVPVPKGSRNLSFRIVPAGIGPWVPEATLEEGKRQLEDQLASSDEEVRRTAQTLLDELRQPRVCHEDLRGWHVTLQVTDGTDSYKREVTTDEHGCALFAGIAPQAVCVVTAVVADADHFDQRLRVKMERLHQELGAARALADQRAQERRQVTNQVADLERELRKVHSGFQMERQRADALERKVVDLSRETDVLRLTIESLRAAQERLRQANEALEERVRERTLELGAANEALQRSNREKAADDLVCAQQRLEKEHARADELAQKVAQLHVDLDKAWALAARRAQERDTLQVQTTHLQQILTALTKELRETEKALDAERRNLDRERQRADALERKVFDLERKRDSGSSQA
jgi:hypothetical protein